MISLVGWELTGIVELQHLTVRSTKPNSKIGIGYDQLPQHIRNSHILSGNDLAKLANVESLPSMEDVEKFKENKDLVKILKSSERNKLEKIYTIIVKNCYKKIKY